MEKYVKLILHLAKGFTGIPSKAIEEVSVVLFHVEIADLTDLKFVILVFFKKHLRTSGKILKV